MKWTHYFDEIYLINLPDNTQRLKSATVELNKYDIPFTVWPAIKHENGKYGLNLTMTELFNKCYNKKRILVFEDDVQFIQGPNIVMALAIDQLMRHNASKYDWEMFYLGLNMDNENNLFNKFVDNNLLTLNFCFSTHAVAYSQKAIHLLSNTLNDEKNHNTGKSFSLAEKPFDQIVNETIGIFQFTRLAVYPMLATQADGWSDIEQKNSTYEYMQQRYNQSVKHLLDDKGRRKI